MINLGNVAMVLADALVLDLGIGFHKFRRRFDGKMGLMGPDIEKEWLIGVPYLLKPTNALVHN